MGVLCTIPQKCKYLHFLGSKVLKGFLRINIVKDGEAALSRDTVREQFRRHSAHRGSKSPALEMSRPQTLSPILVHEVVISPIFEGHQEKEAVNR